MQSFDSDGVAIAYHRRPAEGGTGDSGPADPRLRLEPRGQLGQHALGADPDPGRVPGDRARQPRPRREPEALRSGRLRLRAHGAGCAAPARPSRDRARRRHGLLDGRAHRRLSRPRLRRRASARCCSAASACTSSRARACPSASPKPWRRPPGTPAPNPTAAAFRIFAEQTRSDLRALAACMRGSRQTLSRAEVAQIEVPTLVTVGHPRHRRRAPGRRWRP